MKQRPTPATAASFRYTPLIHAAIIVGATAAAYSGSFRVGWLFDDRPMIVNNPVIHDLGTAIRQTGTWTRSLVQLTFALNYRYGKLDPWGYHLVNLIIHIAAALCLYGWLRIILSPSDTAPAFLAALLFALHPLATQSVTYIVQRYSSMSGLFYFAALWAWAAFRRMERWRWYLAAIAACVLAMLCKEMAATLPWAILLSDFALHERDRSRASSAKRWLALAPLVPLPLLVIALNPVRPAPTGESLVESLNWASGTDVTRGVYFLSQLRVIVFGYLRLALVPAGLCADHVRVVVRTIWDGPTLAAGGVLVVFAGGSSWLALRSSCLQRRVAGVGGILFFLGLAATSSLVPNKQLVQEQRAYVSLAGIVVMVTAGLWSTSFARRGRGAMFLLMAAVLGLLTFQRNKVWQSDERLWKDTLAKNPDSVLAQTSLGVIAMDRQNRMAALDRFRRALALAPGNYIVRYNLGTALMEDGQLEEAVKELRQSAEFKPNEFNTLYNLGNTFRRLGRYDEAAEAYKRALAIAPADYRAHHNLGFTLQQLGRRAEALEHYRAALQSKPDHQPSKDAIEQLAHSPAQEPAR